MHILSVPHTGSRTLHSVLNCPYVHTHSKGRDPGAQEELVRRVIEGKQIVTPLRDPEDVWRSWTNRHNPDTPNPAKHFKRAWELLETYAQEYDLHFITIDRPERDAQLGELLGYKPELDWPAVGHFESDKPPVEADLSWIYELPMIKQFYREK